MVLGLVGSMAKTIHELEADIGKVSYLLAFDCILRKLELSQEGEIPSMERLLNNHSVVGFSTYGEQYNGLHINQTCTGIAFGDANEDG